MGEETEATRTKKAADQVAAATSSMVTAVSRAVTEAVKNAPNKAVASTVTDAGYMEAAASIMKLYGEDTSFRQLQQEALGKPTSLILVKPGEVQDLRATGSRGEKRKHHNRLNDDTDTTDENNNDRKMPATANRTVTPIRATNASVQQNAVESVQVGTRHKTPVDVDCGKNMNDVSSTQHNVIDLWTDSPEHKPFPAVDLPGIPDIAGQFVPTDAEVQNVKQHMKNHLLQGDSKMVQLFDLVGDDNNGDTSTSKMVPIDPNGERRFDILVGDKPKPSMNKVDGVISSMISMCRKNGVPIDPVKLCAGFDKFFEREMNENSK